MANFYSVLLTLITLLAGLIWWYDARFKKPLRLAKIAAEEQRLQTALDDESKQRLAPQGGVAEFAQSVFPILVLILLLRSFAYEPFRIPSASMMPTLLAGDFILVEKFSYGLRDPIWRTQLLATDKPARGDIAVFKYPRQPNVDFIKRVVGLPGDRIIYRDKTLYLQPACDSGVSACAQQPQVIEQQVAEQQLMMFNGSRPLLRLREQLGDVSHDILIDPVAVPREQFYYQQSDQRSAIDEWIVPAGHYFFMGDNRDNSEDSRYWGFVAEDLLVGQAVFIWMSFEFERDANSWLPTWLPSGIRWQRLGRVD